MNSSSSLVVPPPLGSAPPAASSASATTSPQHHKPVRASLSSLSSSHIEQQVNPASIGGSGAASSMASGVTTASSGKIVIEFQDHEIDLKIDIHIVRYKEFSKDCGRYLMYCHAFEYFVKMNGRSELYKEKMHGIELLETFLRVFGVR